MFVSGYFHLLGMRKTRQYIPRSKVGLDLWMDETERDK